MPEGSSNIQDQSIGIKQVPTSYLYPNPHNPRLLFDRQPMTVLQKSIERNGILVPLTVYHEKARDRYVILDGQRRWLCAQHVGLLLVPVNQVAEPDLVQNIVTMFQIHKLREDWELMPTALKIQLLMLEIRDKNDGRLAELTGLDEAVIVRCKKLISYERDFQDMMLDADPERRVKADFFIELYPVIHDRDVAKMPWFRKKQFIRQMLVKYQEEPRTIKAVTDFRLVKQHITNARRINALPALSERLRSFAVHAAETLTSLEIEEASVHAQAKVLIKSITSLYQGVTALDVQQFYGEEDLWDALEDLQATIRAKLSEADKRLK